MQVKRLTTLTVYAISTTSSFGFSCFRVGLRRCACKEGCRDRACFLAAALLERFVSRASAIRESKDLRSSASMAFSRTSDRGNRSSESSTFAAAVTAAQLSSRRGRRLRPCSVRAMSLCRPSCWLNSDSRRPSWIIREIVCVAAGWVMPAKHAILVTLNDPSPTRARTTGKYRGRYAIPARSYSRATAPSRSSRRCRNCVPKPRFTSAP